jgi:hypothetical protein
VSSNPLRWRRAGLSAGGVGGLLELGLRAVLGRRGPATPVAGPAIGGVELLPSPASELGPVVREVAVGRHSMRIGARLRVLT